MLQEGLNWKMILKYQWDTVMREPNPRAIAREYCESQATRRSARLYLPQHTRS